MKIFITLVALAALSHAELFDRPCRTPDQLGVKTRFTPTLYTGIWYEIERYEQVFQAGGECVTAQYTANANGSINVFNQAFVIANNTRVSDTGLAVLSFPNEDPLRAMLNVTFSPLREF
jgi:apolipoprotein D and lipocalin family protein